MSYTERVARMFYFSVLFVFAFVVGVSVVGLAAHAAGAR